MQEKHLFDEYIFLDSCAFDPAYASEGQAALEILNLAQKELISIGIAHSVEKEIEHPNTPFWKKQKALELFFTVEGNLTEREMQTLMQIEQILAGNGRRETIKSDAKHIFETQKYGAHFITTDDRILKKANQLQIFCGIRIFKPSEYVSYFYCEN